jgi:hypothetical protein
MLNVNLRPIVDKVELGNKQFIIHPNECMYWWKQDEWAWIVHEGVHGCIHLDLQWPQMNTIIGPTQIEFDTSISLIHQIRYMMNLNYVVMVKHDIDKLLTIRFI